MDATVYMSGGSYWVSLRVLMREVDVAGPFDDEHDAVLMAERSVFGGGRVTVATRVERAMEAA